MQIARVADDTVQFNRELEAAGVVVRHVAVEGCAAAPDHSDHRRAIILAIEAEVEPGAWLAVATDRPLVNYLKANAMTGTPISPDQFLGPLWDVSRRSPILRGRSPAHLNSYFVGDDEEIDRNVLAPRPRGPGTVADGYVYAFTEPPYSLRLPKRRVLELFAEALRRFMPHLESPDSTLCRWPTDWSRYFDEGREWWGSFAWTYGSPTGEIVAVFASATD